MQVALLAGYSPVRHTGDDAVVAAHLDELRVVTARVVGNPLVIRAPAL